MRMLGRAIASIKYHKKYALVFVILGVIYCTFTNSLLLMIENEREILLNMKSKISMLAGSTQHNTLLSKVYSTREQQIQLYQSWILYLTIITFILFVVIISLYIHHRKTEFLAYQYMGKHYEEISLQFSLESFAVVILAGIFSLVLLATIEPTYFNWIKEIDDTLYINHLPSNIATLASTPTDSSKWASINELFNNHLTNFNGYMLIFESDFGLSKSFANYLPMLIWSVINAAIVAFVANYVTSLVYIYVVHKDRIN